MGHCSAARRPRVMCLLIHLSNSPAPLSLPPLAGEGGRERSERPGGGMVAHNKAPTRLARCHSLGTFPRKRGRDKNCIAAAMPGRTFVSFSPSRNREGAERRSAHPGNKHA